MNEDEVQTEKFSGLKLTGRKISAKRWDELMAGKRYATFSSLPDLRESSSSFVAIGVLYDKGLAKTSATGGRFAQWSFTDFASPHQCLLKLMLYGDAFHAWDTDLGKTVHYGAVFGLLNPTPMASSGSEKTLVSAKVTQATQLVLLGQCPSLGFCSARKKDGQPCSMPCDKEKTGGRLVCFYHVMHQEAQKVKQLAGLNKGSSDSSITVTSGSVPLPVKSKFGAGTRPSDKAAERLLRNPSPRRSAQSSAQPSVHSSAQSVQPKKVDAKVSDAKGPVKTVAPTSALAGVFAPPNRDEKVPEAVSDVERSILAMFPGGLPDVDPNDPAQSQRTLREALGAARPPATPHSQASQQCTQGAREAPKPKPRTTAEPKSRKSSKPSFAKLESDFGRKAASMLSQMGDPRKDLVRQQKSRFESAVELERSAKRMRRLNELEQMDAAQEQMEELKKMKVRAFRCKTCFTTFAASSRQRLRCEESGHTLLAVEATKTRWECSRCRLSEEVLDRQLPSHCRRCHGDAWKQVSLRSVRRTAPMERDQLLPRGEELPFLNSIHIPELQSTWRASKETAEDYDAI